MNLLQMLSCEEAKVGNLLFVVSGALNSSVDGLKVPERFEETLSTFESIRRLFPEAKICYVDAGLLVPDNFQVDLGIKRKITEAVDEFFDLTSEPEILDLRKELLSQSEELLSMSGFSGYSKSRLEAASLSIVFKKLEFPITNVVKVSARYSLSPVFLKSSRFFHLPTVSAFAFRRARRSYLRPKILGLSKWYRTVLWMSKGVSNSELSKIFSDANLLLGELSRAGGIADLEHAMHKLVEGYPVKQLVRVGVSGRVASTGKQILL